MPRHCFVNEINEERAVNAAKYEGINGKQLAKLIGCDQTTASKILRNLEEKGQMKRFGTSSDTKFWPVTDKG